MKESDLEDLGVHQLIELAVQVMRQVNIHGTTTHQGVLLELDGSGDFLAWKAAFEHFPEVS